MAELGDAVLSLAVTKLLDEVLKALKLLKNAPKNVLKLQNLLERLQQSVKQLCHSVQGEHHPADKWLRELQKQLAKSRDLVEASGDIHNYKNIVRRYSTAKESLAVYGNIQVLLQEASVHQWASGMSIQCVFSDNDAKVLADIRTALAEVQGLQNMTNLSSKGSNIVREVFKLEQVFGSVSLSEASSSADPTRALRVHSTCDVPTKPHVTFGGEGVANELTNHLLNVECGKWVGLWGMGGIGKTHTARKVFHDTRVQEHFSGGRFWLTVSKDQPGPNHLLKQLFNKLSGSSSMSRLPEDLEAAKSHLRSQLDRERVLLVLDDVWLDQVLQHLDVLPNDKKCVILVTTRDEGIFRKVIRSTKIFKVPRLSPKDSWKLFCYHACRDRDEVIPLEVATIAKKMAEECGGLPLALEIIGSMMADKELLPTAKAMGQTALRVWECTLVQLKGANLVDNEYEALCLKLQLSVDNLLEQDSRLQDCFFYFAAFQEDEDVPIERLVRMWIAEGLVQDNVKSSFSADEEGRVLLGILVAKSMIEVTRDRQCCRIHDVLRDLALRNLKWNIPKQEEIQAPARQCLYAAGWHEDKLPKEWILSASPYSAKRLSLHGSDLEHFPGSKQFLAPHLQVLILSETRRLQSLSPRFFQNLSKLKVLDLSGSCIEKITSELLQRLDSLVLLNLHGCESLWEVSNKINRLQYLEFLDLSQCTRLQNLPQVNNLTKLRKYHASVPLVSVPKANNCCNCWPQKCLRRGAVPYELPCSLRQLQLKFHGSGKYVFDVSSLNLLEKLSLHWYPLPQPVIACTGVMQLRQLKVLRIFGDYWEQLQDFGTFPFLECLVLVVMYANGMESYYSGEGAFPSLKDLTIEYTGSKGRTFIFHPGTMPKIESLDLEISDSKHVPPSIVELRTLKHIRLCSQCYEISDEDLESIFKQPDCFPYLESLYIYEFHPDRLSPEPIRLPKHILDRHKHGLLRIVTSMDFQG